jgi:hypothetical protein
MLQNLMIQRQTFPIVYVIFSLSLLLSAAAFASPQQNSNRKSIANSFLESSNGDFGELTSALTRLDQQFQIQQRSKKTRSRWQKVTLPSDEEGEEDSSSTDDYVWLLEPPSNSIPSCIIVFTGGAGLGQFPHIAYNEVLCRVSDRLNAVCITTPYKVGLDHFALAKQTGDRLRRALIYCQEDPTKQYPSSIPTYALTHSLGGKLQTIYLGATGQEFDGIGLMSFNNFSFSQTISMARSFAEQLRTNTRKDAFAKGPLENEEILNTVFSFAENIVKGIGVDFTPNAQETEQLIQMRYDDILQRKTRLFVFDEDNLDSSLEFMDNCSGGTGPSTSGLSGNHLAPVFFKLAVDELDLGDVPQDAQDMAKEAMGGFESASFGDEQVLNELVDEICNWIMGRPPKREPQWESQARNEPPRLAGFSTVEK